MREMAFFLQQFALYSAVTDRNRARRTFPNSCEDRLSNTRVL